jgi:Mg2+ and Co2+ transporter CorA
MPDISRLVIEVDSKGVVKATGDLKAFEAIMSKSGSSSKKTSDGFAAFQLVVNKLPGPIQGVVSGLTGMVRPATALVGVFLELGKAAINFAKGSIQAFGEFEMIQTNLEVVLGSAEGAKKAFEELKEMGARTPFDVAGLANAAVQLKQTGTQMEDMTRILGMLGDAAGGSNEKFNRLVANYAQVQSLGKTTSMDIKQFAMMGLPIYDVLREMGVRGNATAEEITKAFEKMTQKGGAFYNGMAKGAETLQGKQSTLNDTAKEFMATFAETSGLGDWWKDVLDGLTEWMQNLTDMMNEGERVQSAYKDVENNNENASEENKLTVVEKELKKLIAYEEQYQLALEKSGLQSEQMRYMNLIASARKQITELESQRGIHRNNLDIINAQNDALEKQRSLIRNASGGYAGLLDKIQAAYEKTPEFERESAEKEWSMWETILNSEHERVIQQERSRGIPGRNMETTEVIIKSFLPEDLQEQIRAIQRNIKSGSGSSSGKLADWQQLLKSSFSFDDKDVAGFLKFSQKGSDGLKKFGDRLEHSESAMMEYFDVLGMEFPEILKNTVETWKKAISAISQSDITWDKKNELLNKMVGNLKKAQDDYNKAHEEDMWLNLEEEKYYNRLSLREEAIQRLKDEEGISPELAELIIEFKRKNEEQHGLDGILQDIHEAMENFDRTKDGNTWLPNTYNALQLAESGMGVVQQSQVGNVISGAMEGASAGGPWGGIIGAFLAVLEELMGGMEGLNIVLNPITEVTKELQPIVKAILLPLAIINRLINNFIKLISPVIKAIFGDMEEMYDTISATNDERKKEEERLKALNEQYAKLLEALKEQEEYYLKKRRELNADWAIEQLTGVNDMILTPHGNFSTNPNDYIIATKNPSALGGAPQVSVKIINNTNSNVTTSGGVGANGLPELLVMIDERVQGNIASGKYENAFNVRDQRNAGRRISS